MIKLCRNCLFFSSVTSRPRYCRTLSRNNEPLKILEKQLFEVGGGKPRGAGFPPGRGSPGSSSPRSRLGLDFQSLLSHTCAGTSVPPDRGTFTSLREHFIQTAGRFAAVANCQERHWKPTHPAAESSASPASLAAQELCVGPADESCLQGISCGTRSIQTLCFPAALFALSSCLMPCLLLRVISLTPGTTKKQINL